MGFQVTRTLQERFDEKWLLDTRSGCWLWTGATSSHGYGRIFWNGTVYRASRISWFLRHGVLPPEELHACHHCDTPACVNPDHIFLGTRSDNHQDSIAKGRHIYKRGYGKDWSKERPRISKRARKFCKRGHPFSGENLYVDPDGYAGCKECLWRSRKR